MTTDERREINLSVLGSERALAAWLKAGDALQAFANATEALPGADVVRWYEERSEACFMAQERAVRK